MKQLHAVAMLSVVLVAGCAKKASDEIDFGSIENSVYRNEYFGLTLTLPAGWSVQDRESQREIMKAGAEVVAKDDKNLKAFQKAADTQNVNLFAAFKHPLGTPVPFNPNIICIAERVRHMPGIKRGKDYLFHIKKVLDSSPVEVSYPKAIYTEQIGGLDFDIMTTEMSVAGVTVKQKQFATIIRGYALLMNTSATNDEEASELADVISSVAFD